MIGFVFLRQCPDLKKFNSLTRAFNKDKSWVKLDAAIFPSQKKKKKSANTVLRNRFSLISFRCSDTTRHIAFL